MRLVHVCDVDAEMTTRRVLTPAGQRRIADDRNWQAPGGQLLCLENRQVVFLGTGKKPRWDHIFPLADGGGNEDDDFQPMSPESHQKKSNAEATARARVRHITGANKERPKRRFPKGRGFGIPGLMKKLDGTVVKI